jgi:hypothetical protein
MREVTEHSILPGNGEETTETGSPAKQDLYFTMLSEKQRMTQREPETMFLAKPRHLA